MIGKIFQSMKSPVELNSLLSKFFCYIAWLLYQLIRRETGRLANEAFMSNPISFNYKLLSLLCFVYVSLNRSSRPEMFCKEGLLKICKIHRKISVLESLFNKISGLKA